MGKHTKDATKNAAGKPIIKDKTKKRISRLGYSRTLGALGCKAFTVVDGWGERTSRRYVEKGKFKDGKLHGPGMRLFHDCYEDDLWRGSLQEGLFESGIFVKGTEKRTKEDIVLEGTFKRFLAGDHPGQCDDADSEHSEFISGTKTAPDGTVSKGTFTPRAAYCVLHGDDCVETTPDGIVRKGTFDHGDFTAGTETHPNGETREGTFRFGHGKGKITYGKDSKTGILVSSGLSTSNDHGGSMFSGPAVWAEGSWDPEGKLNGPGKMMHKVHYAMHEGIFANNMLVQGKKIEAEGFGEGTFDDKGLLHGQGKRVFCIEYGDVYCQHGPEAAAAHLIVKKRFDWGQGIFCHGKLHGFADCRDAFSGKYGVVTHGEPCSYSEGMQELLNLQDEESEEEYLQDEESEEE